MPQAKKSGYSASFIERTSISIGIESLKAFRIAPSVRASMYELRPRATLAAPTEEEIPNQLQS
jgi:hypothetical protein